MKTGRSLKVIHDILENERMNDEKKRFYGDLVLVSQVS